MTDQTYPGFNTLYASFKNDPKSVPINERQKIATSIEAEFSGT